MRMLLTLPLATLLIGCGSASKTDTTSTPAKAGAQTVKIQNFKYGAALTVAVGTKVTWINEDNAPHTVTGTGLKLGTLMKGDQRSFTFTKAGTYNYVCEFHPFMHGTVIVQ